VLFCCDESLVVFGVNEILGGKVNLPGLIMPA